MDMTGEERIAAKREIVWQALNSPNILRKCIPNCESLDKKSPTEMDAAIKLKLGPISTTLKATVGFSNINPPESYTITVEGKSLVAGSAKGKCDVKLVSEGEETLLVYTIGAEMGGAIAKLGAKMIESTSKKVAESFFKKFSKLAAKRAAKVAAKGQASEDDDADE